MTLAVPYINTVPDVGRFAVERAGSETVGEVKCMECPFRWDAIRTVGVSRVEIIGCLRDRSWLPSRTRSVRAETIRCFLNPVKTAGKDFSQQFIFVANLMLAF